MRIAWLMVALTGACFAADQPKSASRDGVFVDAQRAREIPYRIHYPDPLSDRHPVIVVSHGLGGSKENNALLGRYLAGRGYVVVHVQHPGSDSSVYAGKRDRRAIQQALAASLRQPRNALGRFMDLPFVIAELARLNEHDAVLKDRLDLQALGVAGHSYGAVSAMVAAGQGVGPRLRTLKAPQVRAGLVLSPSPPDSGDAAAAYREVDIPLFHMTGTKDASPAVAERDVSPADRIKPYEALRIPDQYLLVLHDADHMTFAGSRIGSADERPSDKRHMTAILNGAALFFDAHLKNEADKKSWLRSEFKKLLANEDRFEFK
jgi:predicted dienelactone hydrolase